MPKETQKPKNWEGNWKPRNTRNTRKGVKQGCIPKLLVNGDDRWTSRSDDLTVAVGFNPRNEPGDLISREATIDLPEIERSDRTSLRDLLLGWSHARGLKATATFMRRSAAAGSALVWTNTFEMHGPYPR